MVLSLHLLHLHHHTTLATDQPRIKLLQVVTLLHLHLLQEITLLTMIITGIEIDLHLPTNQEAIIIYIDLLFLNFMFSNELT